MPIQVTTEGLQKNSGLPKSVSINQNPPAEMSKRPATMRQDLPAGMQSLPSFNTLEDQEETVEVIERKVEDLNSHVQNLQPDLQFNVDAESGRTIIKVIDAETRETIRTIPPEDISVLAQSLERHTGVLFKAKV